MRLKATVLLCAALVSLYSFSLRCQPKRGKAYTLDGFVNSSPFRPRNGRDLPFAASLVWAGYRKKATNYSVYCGAILYPVNQRQLGKLNGKKPMKPFRSGYTLFQAASC
jgi:hypothetical protein